MPSPSILIAALAGLILIAIAVLLTPVFQADQQRMVGSNDNQPDVTERTLMGLGAFLVVCVPACALWLGSVWQ